MVGGMSTTVTASMARLLLLLLLFLSPHNSICGCEEIKTPTPEEETATASASPPLHISSQDRLERAKTILGIKTPSQEKDNSVLATHEAQDPRTILNSLKVKLSKLSLSKDADVERKASQGEGDGGIKNNIFDMLPGQDVDNVEESIVAEISEVKKQTSNEESRRQGRNKLIQMMSEELGHPPKTREEPSITELHPPQETQEFPSPPEAPEKTEQHLLASQEAEGDIERERVPTLYDRMVKLTKIYQGEEDAGPEEPEQQPDVTSDEPQIISTNIKPKITSTGTLLEPEITSTTTHIEPDITSTSTRFKPEITSACSEPEMQANANVDSLKAQVEKDIAVPDKQTKQRDGSIEKTLDQSKESDIVAQKSNEIDMYSDEVYSYVSDKVKSQISSTLVTKDINIIVDSDDKRSDIEKKVAESVVTSEIHTNLNQEEREEVKKDDNIGVQPVERSLYVERKVLSAIDDQHEPLANLTTGPSPVLAHHHKILTHQKPGVTISHYINAKDFFRLFPHKNFTYADKQAVPSLSSTPSSDEHGTGDATLTPTPDSSSNPIDKAAHSLTTVDAQESLLQDGRQNEIDVTPPDEVAVSRKDKEEKDPDEKKTIEVKDKSKADLIYSVLEGKEDQGSSEQSSAQTEDAAKLEDIPSTELLTKESDKDELYQPSDVKIEVETEADEVQKVNETISKKEEEILDTETVKPENETSTEEKPELAKSLKPDSVPTSPEKEKVTETGDPTPEAQVSKEPKEPFEGEAEKQAEDVKASSEPEKEPKKEDSAKPDKEVAETVEAEENEQKKIDKESKKTTTKEESEKEESEKEESEKAADTLETYSQFTQRVNAEKKNGIITNGHGSNGHSKGPKVKSKNYASPDCGSKLLTANPEATHASKVIHANRDEYMLNKCRDKIWFNIELCESIRPQKFDIANFELFSNLPKDLVVSGSHRYPTREWTPLARVTGQEGNRGVQAFNIDTEDFFKYIKVEVLSHYGSEFFCPISLFRIYGLSEFEVIDTIDESADESDDSDDTDEIPEIPEEHDKKKTKEEGKPSVIPAVLKNMWSGVLDVIKRGYRPSTSTTDPTVNCFSLPSSLVVAVTSCHLAQSLNYILSCYWAEYQQLMQKPVVALTVKNSGFCRLLASSMCLDSQVNDSIVYDTVCNNSYVCVMLSPKHVLAMCFMHDSRIINGEVSCSSPDTHLPENFSATSPDIISPDKTVPAYVKNAKINTSSITRADASDVTGSVEPDQSITLQNKENKSAPVDEESGSVVDTTAASKLPESSLTQTPKPPKKSKKTSSSQKDKQESGGQDNSTEPDMEQQVEDSGLAGEELEGEEVAEHKPEEDLSPPSSPPPSTTPSPSTPAPPPSPPQPETKSTSPTNKESVVVRLSNKIKALEYNMSISSQYLEELSRRYKRQMEEMQRQFNLTIAALNATSHQAYERDQQHQRDIEALEKQLDMAKEALDMLVDGQDNLANTVVEQHLLLMVVEVVVLCVVFTWCYRRSPYQALPTHTRAQTPGDDGCERGEGRSEGERGRVRRRSVDSITRARNSQLRQRRPSEEALRISGTYQDLLIIEPAIPIMVDSVSDRRRKKKSSSSGGLKRSKSNASIVEKTACSSSRQARRIENLDSSSAGVLFCGDQQSVEPPVPPSDPLSSPDSPDAPTFPYQPFVNEEDLGYYSVCGEFGPHSVRPCISEIIIPDLEMKDLVGDSGNPKRHTIAGYHTCDSSTKKPLRLSKSLSLGAAPDQGRSGAEKVKKHRKVKKNKSDVLENINTNVGESHYLPTSYSHEYYCDTISPVYSQQRHYMEYYYNDHNAVHYNETTNGHGTDDVFPGPNSYVNGDSSQVLNMLGSEHFPSSYENPVIEQRKSSPTTKVKLRSDNWEWYTTQHCGASSSETVSTSSDCSSKHRKPNLEDKSVVSIPVKLVGKSEDKKMRKKKKLKVRTSVVVLEEEGEAGT